MSPVSRDSQPTLSIYRPDYGFTKRAGRDPRDPRPTMRGRRALSSHEPRKPRGARGVDNFPFILSSRERVSLCNTSKISNTEMNYLQRAPKISKNTTKRKAFKIELGYAVQPPQPIQKRQAPPARRLPSSSQRRSRRPERALAPSPPIVAAAAAGARRGPPRRRP